MVYRKLIGRIKEKGLSQRKLAEKLHISRCTLSSKLNSKTNWSLTEVQKCCEFLDIMAEDVSEYFFDNYVKKTLQKKSGNNGIRIKTERQTNKKQRWLSNHRIKANR